MKEIPLSIPHINGNEWKYIKECLDTNWVSSVGKFVNKFEEEIADYVGADHAVATVNGTAALHIALKVLGIGKGDMVLVPSLTFIASVNPIIYCGAEPVFIDSEEKTCNIDSVKLKVQIEKMVAEGNKPAAVIVVHLFGHPAQMDPIIELCRKYDIYIIEDATESLGSEYKGIKTGALGDIGCFSFNGNKLITTGGGGMLVTDNEEWSRKAKYLTTQAKDDPEQFIHNEIGYNYRLTNIQAAMGVAQLEQIDDFIKKKRWIASKYTEGLQQIPGIRVIREADRAFNNYWLYSILINEKEYGINSKELYKKLNEKGIMARPFFKPIHQMQMYKKYKSDIKIADLLWEEGINLPASVGIDIKEVDYIIETINKLSI